jgi:hypothetical protein
MERVKGGESSDIPEVVNLNKSNGWLLMKQAAEKEGGVVVVVPNGSRLLSKRLEDPHTRKNPAKKEGNSKPKTNEAKKKQRDRDVNLQHEAKVDEMAVYVARVNLSTAERKCIKAITRDGGDTWGCSCRGCTGYTKERNERMEKKQELGKEVRFAIFFFFFLRSKRFVFQNRLASICCEAFLVLKGSKSNKS